MFSHFSASKHTSPSNSRQGGFGLIELLVSISIMVIVTGVILARQSSFNGAVLLRSQAHEVALALREIQLDAVGAQSDGSGDFRLQHGVFFTTTSGSNAGYRIFRDADSDGIYDVGEEYGPQGFLDDRFIIDSIDEIGTANTVTAVSVMFERPNFDARFFSSSGTEFNDVAGYELVIRRVGTSGTGAGDIRAVEVTRAGQISVK